MRCKEIRRLWVRHSARISAENFPTAITTETSSRSPLTTQHTSDLSSFCAAWGPWYCVSDASGKPDGPNC